MKNIKMQKVAQTHNMDVLYKVDCAGDISYSWMCVSAGIVEVNACRLTERAAKRFKQAFRAYDNGDIPEHTMVDECFEIAKGDGACVLGKR